MKTLLKILIPLAILAALGYYFFFKNANSQAQMPQGMMTPEVVAKKLNYEKVEIVEELPGRTSAFKISEVRPQVTGIVLKRLFKEGGAVKKGQQLYQIDSGPYVAAFENAKAALQKAQANLKSAENKYFRYEELIKVDAVSKQEYDDIRAAFAQAKADTSIARANLKTATINLNYTKVFAPISGKIGKSSVTEGALITANQTDALAVITQLDPIFVDAIQPVSDIIALHNQLQKEDEIFATLFFAESGETYEHEGKLQFSEAIVDESTSSVELRTIFPNPDAKLLPGLFVKTKIKFSVKEAILVPQNATSRNPQGELMVWKIDEKNVANPIIIKSQKAVGNKWLVADGLKAGDVIVIEGYQKLVPQTNVKPIFKE